MLIVLHGGPIATPFPAVALESSHSGTASQDDAVLPAVVSCLPFGRTVEGATFRRCNIGTFNGGILDGVDVDREPECVGRQARRAGHGTAVECARIVRGHRGVVVSFILVDALHALYSECSTVVDFAKDT